MLSGFLAFAMAFGVLADHGVVQRHYLGRHDYIPTAEDNAENTALRNQEDAVYSVVLPMLTKARDLADEGRISEAGVLYGRADVLERANYPERADPHLAEWNFVKGDYSAAAAYFRTNDKPYRFELAICDCEIGLDQEAYRAISPYLSEEAYRSIGPYSQDGKQYADLFDVLNVLPISKETTLKAIEATAWAMLAEKRRGSHKPTWFLRTMERASVLAPENPFIRYEKGRGLIATKHKQEGLTLCKGALDQLTGHFKTDAEEWISRMQ